MKTNLDLIGQLGQVYKYTVPIDGRQGDPLTALCTDEDGAVILFIGTADSYLTRFSHKNRPFTWY